MQEDPKYRIYWGDTHAHTNMAEAQGTLENFYRFAREDARLDFIALSEHDVWMEDNEWERLKAGVKRYNEEGRFLALLSYEWTAIVDYGGHHNVLFRTPEGRRRVPIQETDGLWALLEGLKADNDPEDVLVIPHAHIPGDWRIADPKLERLVEVLSMHGTFEWFGNYYLQNGHMVGFVGASDDHSGRPGYSGPFRNGPLQQFNGLGAVMAPELTTDAIFDAMRDISAYATSGQRTILDLRLNGTPMGKRLKFTKQRKIEGRVMATSPIDTIEVVKNSKVVYVESASRRPELADGWVQVSFGSASEDLIRDVPRGHRIWRGTLDVKNATLRGVNPLGHNDVYAERVAIDENNPNRMNFRLVTRGRDDSFLIDLEGVSDKTELAIHTEAAQEEGVTFPRFYRPGRMPETDLTLSFANLKGGQTAALLPVGRYTDRIAAQLVNPDGPMDYDFSYTDKEEPRDGDYYYVRVKQLDGDMAWSSPWWVGGIPPR